MLKEQIKRESPAARVDSDTTEVAGCGSDVVGSDGSREDSAGVAGEEGGWTGLVTW